jgi:hypothetical protein
MKYHTFFIAHPKFGFLTCDYLTSSDIVCKNLLNTIRCFSHKFIDSSILLNCYIACPTDDKLLIHKSNLRRRVWRAFASTQSCGCWTRRRTTTRPLINCRLIARTPESDWTELISAILREFNLTEAPWAALHVCNYETDCRHRRRCLRTHTHTHNVYILSSIILLCNLSQLVNQQCAQPGQPACANWNVNTNMFAEKGDDEFALPGVNISNGFQAWIVIEKL